MDKFARGLRYAIEFIQTGVDPEEGKEEILNSHKSDGQTEDFNKLEESDNEDIIF